MLSCLADYNKYVHGHYCSSLSIEQAHPSVKHPSEGSEERGTIGQSHQYSSNHASGTYAEEDRGLNQTLIARMSCIFIQFFTFNSKFCILTSSSIFPKQIIRMFILELRRSDYTEKHKSSGSDKDLAASVFLWYFPTCFCDILKNNSKYFISFKDFY